MTIGILVLVAGLILTCVGAVLSANKTLLQLQQQQQQQVVVIPQTTPVTPPETKFCSGCGTPINSQAKICENCGAQQ